jgi:UDP-N-acetyl-D-galactosamine dehydrogenase
MIADLDGLHVREVNSTPVDLPNPATASVAIIGLGYVGLPLAVGFSKAAPAIGFDISKSKVDQLKDGLDVTGEVTSEDLEDAQIEFTTEVAAIATADVIVVCVPTPVNAYYKPDYTSLLSASHAIAQNMKRGAIVVYESTVDPGTTEDKCLPILEGVSRMKQGVDFYVGYSPERINPGDPTRKLADIKKIVAGSNPEITDFLEQFYSRVINAGLCKAASIRVAEAAKILENTQRDVNIALMNEMMKLFDSMGIRTSDVVAAAGSKWNFHHYRPGLVGGHCIAVDPYFLVDAGRRNGLSMDLVAASRTVNEGTPRFLAEKLEELMANATTSRKLNKSRVLVLGRSFKENCPDTRNSKAYVMMDGLWLSGAEVHCFDPIADASEHEGGRGVTLIDDLDDSVLYDAVIVTLSHDYFRENVDLSKLKSLTKKHAALVDLRGLYDVVGVSDHFTYWRP